MKINCLACGHSLNLDAAYDDYEGQVKCLACGAILQIKAEQGSVRSVHFVALPRRPTREEVLLEGAR